MSPKRKIKQCFGSQGSKVKEAEPNLSCNLSAAEPSSLNDPHLMFLPLAAQEQDSDSEKKKQQPRNNNKKVPLPPQSPFESSHGLARRNFCSALLP